MRTLVIDGVFFQENEWSGIAKYWRTMLQELDIIAAANKDLRIFLLVRGKSLSLRNADFENIHVLPVAYFDPVCALSDFHELGQLCKALKATAFVSSYYTLAYGVPNIGMAYDFIPEAMGWMDNHIWKIKEIYMHSLERSLSISSSTAHAASLYYPNLISGDGDIFYPPLSPEECFPYGDDAVRKLRIKYALNYPFAAVVGHREDYKNIDLLDQALLSRPPQAKALPLGLVATAGKPLTTTEIELYQKHFQFGICRVRLNSDEMPIFFRAAEFLFYPSLLEGFGYPVAEALAQRCPVITTGATSIGEILAHAEPDDYRIISGHDGHEALQAFIGMLHSRKRVSAATAQRIQSTFGKIEADRFLQRLLELATITALPRTPHLEACLSLDGVLA